MRNEQKQRCQWRPFPRRARPWPAAAWPRPCGFGREGRKEQQVLGVVAATNKWLRRRPLVGPATASNRPLVCQGRLARPRPPTPIGLGLWLVRRIGHELGREATRAAALAALFVLVPLGELISGGSRRPSGARAGTGTGERDRRSLSEQTHLANEQTLVAAVLELSIIDL